MESGTLRFVLRFKAFRDVGGKVSPMAPYRISMLIYENSGLVFGTIGGGGWEGPPQRNAYLERLTPDLFKDALVW